jgi:hypothetical protein
MVEYSVNCDLSSPNGLLEDWYFPSFNHKRVRRKIFKVCTTLNKTRKEIMLQNRDTIIELSNKNLSVQINKLPYTLPPKSQSFYQDPLNKSNQAESAITQKDISSVINYEIVFLALPKRE